MRIYKLKSGQLNTSLYLLGDFVRFSAGRTYVQSPSKLDTLLANDSRFALVSDEEVASEVEAAAVIAKASQPSALAAALIAGTSVGITGAPHDPRTSEYVTGTKRDKPAVFSLRHEELDTEAPLAPPAAPEPPPAPPANSVAGTVSTGAISSAQLAGLANITKKN